MADIHDQADDVIAEADADTESALVGQCLDDLDWVTEAARHMYDEHPLTDHERVKLIGEVLQATQDRIELLRHGL